MAEGLLRRLAPDRFEVESAGTEATRVHPLAIEAMREIGIDISGHRSKTLDGFVDQPWDYVITVCDHANERCPLFPGRTQRIHWSFEDPSAAPGSSPTGARAAGCTTPWTWPRSTRWRISSPGSGLDAAGCGWRHAAATE